MPRVWWEDKDSNKILTDRKALQKAVLSITNAGNADNGKYVCHANNSVGQANKDVEVIVSGMLVYPRLPLFGEKYKLLRLF